MHGDSSNKMEITNLDYEMLKVSTTANFYLSVFKFHHKNKISLPISPLLSEYQDNHCPLKKFYNYLNEYEVKYKKPLKDEGKFCVQVPTVFSESCNFFRHLYYCKVTISLKESCSLWMPNIKYIELLTLSHLNSS